MTYSGDWLYGSKLLRVLICRYFLSACIIFVKNLKFIAICVICKSVLCYWNDLLFFFKKCEEPRPEVLEDIRYRNGTLAVCSRDRTVKDTLLDRVTVIALWPYLTKHNLTFDNQRRIEVLQNNNGTYLANKIISCL